jgi:hypothetical protein
MGASLMTRQEVRISQEEIGCWLASYFGADFGERKSIWRQQLVDASTPGGCSLLKRVMAMTGFWKM